MSCDLCSVELSESIPPCSICKKCVCDKCYNKTIDNYVALDGTIHDNSHFLMEDEIKDPINVYISFNLKEITKCVFGIEGVDNFSSRASNNSHFNYKIFVRKKEYIVFDVLICRQVNLILLIREFLDSLNYPEQLIDTFLKDLLRMTRGYNYIMISFCESPYNLFSTDKVKHYTDILLLWEGFTEFIETNEICVKKKYEKVMNKSDYSTSIAVSKK